MDGTELLRQRPGEEGFEPRIDVGTIVAGYRVERVLARDPWRHTLFEASGADGRRVALKVVRPGSSDGRSFRRRFRRSIDLRASIVHPNLLPIFGTGERGDELYVIMGLSRAKTLAELLELGPLGPDVSLRLLGQLADALEVAHARGLLHRELAPEDVLVEPRDGGHVLLGDFGAAKPEWREGLSHLVEPSHYLSPEELRGEPIGAESNVYSLGCMLVECLSGQPPFTSELPGMVAYAHLSEPPPRLSERRPELPAAIDQVIAIALAKEPEERRLSPTELIGAAAQAMAGDAASSAVRLPSQRLAARPPRPPAPTVAGHGAHRSTRARITPPQPAVPLRRLAASLRGWRPPLAGPTGVLRRGAGTLRGWRPPPAPTLRLRRPQLGRPARLLGGAAAGARVRRPELGRAALLIAAALVVGATGAVGFLAGRSLRDDRRPNLQGASLHLRAERERQRRDYLRQASAAVKRLNADRVAARRRLAAARTPAAQAAEGERLAGAYRSAALAFPRRPPAAGGEALLPPALTRAEGAYRRLAATAGRRDRRGYEAARRGVARSEAELEGTLTRLAGEARQP